MRSRIFVLVWVPHRERDVVVNSLSMSGATGSGLRPAVSPVPETPLEPPLDLRPEIQWLDFSSISNPLGTPPEITEAIAEAVKRNTIQYAPDRDAHQIRAMLAWRFGLPAGAFLCGTGVTELIRAVAQTYQPCRVGISLPCRQEYALAIANAGHSITDITGSSGFFTPDPGTLTQAGAEFDAALLSNPGYPSSRLLPQPILIKYLERCKWVIVDERSIELSFAGESMVSLTSRYRNLIVIRSLTETFALDGTPVSYCVAHPDTIGQISLFFDTSATTMFAEVIAPVLPRLDSYIDRAHDILDTEIPWMQWMLNLIPGIQIYPAEANYILCELVNDGSLNIATKTADELSATLAGMDFGIHPLNGIPGLEDHRFFCVGIKTHTENERFVRALRSALQSRG